MAPQRPEDGFVRTVVGFTEDLEDAEDFDPAAAGLEVGRDAIDQVIFGIEPDRIDLEARVFTNLLIFLCRKVRAFGAALSRGLLRGREVYAAHMGCGFII